MKKVKKVNGFAIMELSDKEKKEYGFRFGVIDPEIITGITSLDISAMEYDNIDSLAEVIEKAASL